MKEDSTHIPYYIIRDYIIRGRTYAPLHAPFTPLTRAMGIGYRLFRPREEEKLSIIPPFSTIITTFAPLLLTNI